VAKVTKKMINRIGENAAITIVYTVEETRVWTGDLTDLPDEILTTLADIINNDTDNTDPDELIWAAVDRQEWRLTDHAEIDNEDHTLTEVTVE